MIDSEEDSRKRASSFLFFLRKNEIFQQTAAAQRSVLRGNLYLRPSTLQQMHTLSRQRKGARHHPAEIRRKKETHVLDGNRCVDRQRAVSEAEIPFIFQRTREAPGERSIPDSIRTTDHVGRQDETAQERKVGDGLRSKRYLNRVDFIFYNGTQFNSEKGDTL